MAVPSGKLIAAEVGARIRQLREKRNWTQAQLAVYAGVGLTTVARCEAGVQEPRLEQLMKIAFVLDVGVAALLPADLSLVADESGPQGRGHQRKRSAGSKGQTTYSELVA